MIPGSTFQRLGTAVRYLEGLPSGHFMGVIDGQRVTVDGAFQFPTNGNADGATERRVVEQGGQTDASEATSLHREHGVAGEKQNENW